MSLPAQVVPGLLTNGNVLALATLTMPDVSPPPNCRTITIHVTLTQGGTLRLMRRDATYGLVQAAADIAVPSPAPADGYRITIEYGMLGFGNYELLFICGAVDSVVQARWGYTTNGRQG